MSGQAVTFRSFWVYKIAPNMTLVVLSTKKFGNQTPVGDKERVNINKGCCNAIYMVIKDIFCYQGKKITTRL